MRDPIKKALRETMKQVRTKVPPSYRTTASNQVCARIRSLEQYRHAKRIALYSAINGEIDLENIWSNAPLQGKFCYFPSVNEDSKTLSFLPATPVTPFKKNRYGILEPDVSYDTAIPVEELDIIIMPLIAFDIRCTRLGTGCGYYDRTLQGKDNCTLFGAAYQFQRADFIEPKEWDIPLDAVITQQAVYWRNP